MKSNKNGYILHKTDTSISLCKILNEYKLNDSDQAENDLIDLLMKKRTEKDILKEYDKKDILK